MDEEAIQLGLLMETAQTHQKLAEAALEKLQAHTAGLDSVVREQIRRTLIEELHGMHHESQRAVEALRRIQRTANVRVALWSMGITVMSAVIALAAVYWSVSSSAGIAGLGPQRDRPVTGIQLLKQDGRRVDLRPCGDHHLCARVDLKAPRYGAHADYLILKGY